MTTLIITNADKDRPHPTTANLITAANQLGNPYGIAVISPDPGPASHAASFFGCTHVIHMRGEDCPEVMAPVLVEYIRKVRFTHVLAPATTFGKNLLPRVAALLDVMQISDVTAIRGPYTFERPIYAGNAITTVESSDPLQVMTIRATAFALMEQTQSPCDIETYTPSWPDGAPVVFNHETTPSSRPDLGQARVVVAGGRGLQGSENFKLLEDLADCLNAAIGATRAAVDAGYVPNEYQVGQTGKIVAPELYIAIGISGAVQHLAGMKGSKVIVAINKDPDAPIFQVADYGLVGDLFEIVPQLTAALRGR